MGISFSETTGLLQRALDGVWARQQAASQNIANADTPGYKRHTIAFEGALHAAIERLATGEPGGDIKLVRTDPGHLPLDTALDPASVPINRGIDSSTSLRNDQNNVDIDVEMTQLAQDSLRYQALTQAVAKRYSMLKSTLR